MRALAAVALLAPAARALAEPPTDDEVRSAWRALPAAERLEVLQWWEAELPHLGTLQHALVVRALGAFERDAGTVPPAPPLEHFDPEVHAPRQPIPRRWLKPTDSRARRERERLFEQAGTRRLTPAYRYSYARRQVERVADDRDPEHLLALAVAGLPPYADLAEAIVESLLDDGSQQVVLAAFDHAYTDRSGNAYPGVTLYDAWASQVEIEMPDVDNLALVHVVLDERRWNAPVATEDHDPLYELVGQLFERAHRHRGLRHALARTYLLGTETLRDGYGFHRERFHALWAEHDSDPASLAEELPAVEDWAEFLGDATVRIEKDVELLRAARSRRDALDRDAELVRAQLVRILGEFDAFARVGGRPSAERRGQAR